MTTIKITYEDGIVYLDYKIEENSFYVNFSLNEKKNDFKKFLATFVRNKTCDVTIRDTYSKDSDIFMRYKSNIMCIRYHNTVINLTRESVLDEFTKIIKMINMERV